MMNDIYDTGEDMGIYDAAEGMGNGPVIVIPEADLLGQDADTANVRRVLAQMPRVRKLPHKEYIYPKFRHPGRVRAAALREQITDYLYDTIQQGDFSTGNVFKVFTNVGGKTLEMTNLETNGQLPWQEAFKVLGIVAVPTPPQIDSIAEKGQVELMTMGQNQRPLSEVILECLSVKLGEPPAKLRGNPEPSPLWTSPLWKGVETRRQTSLVKDEGIVQTTNILN